jgi:hypothetical protein
VELSDPITGAPLYNGRDRRELEGRLLAHGLINASLRQGELIAMVAAPPDAEPGDVARLIAAAATRPPRAVRLAQQPEG